MCARVSGLDPGSTSGSAVSTVARNLFDSFYFRHDTRQDTRGLPFGTIQGLPDPDKHCLQKGEHATKVSTLGLLSSQRIE